VWQKDWYALTLAGRRAAESLGGSGPVRDSDTGIIEHSAAKMDPDKVLSTSRASEQAPDEAIGPCVAAKPAVQLIVFLPESSAAHLLLVLVMVTRCFLEKGGRHRDSTLDKATTPRQLCLPIHLSPTSAGESVKSLTVRSKRARGL
jgi:hypothetical protein